MANFKEVMRQAREAASDEWAPSVGTHDAIVVDGSAFESGAGDMWAKTTLALREPGSDDDGRQWDHLMGFKSPKGAAMSADQLALYGITVDDYDEIEDLSAALGELGGLLVTVSCTARDTDGVWTKITGSRTGRSDVTPSDAARDMATNGTAPPPDDDDIPF